MSNIIPFPIQPPPKMCYFDFALNQKKMKETVCKVSKDILEHIEIFPEYVAGTGVSGILPLPTFSEIYNSEMLIVRKPGDGTHSYNRIETVDYYKSRKSDSIIVIDDFIISGRTIDRVFETLVDGGYKIPAAIVLYNVESFEHLGGFVKEYPNLKHHLDHIPIIGYFHAKRKIFLKNIPYDDYLKEIFKKNIYACEIVK